jgi:sodium/potassium-transporting ATPase subunit alpha
MPKAKKDKEESSSSSSAEELSSEASSSSDASSDNSSSDGSGDASAHSSSSDSASAEPAPKKESKKEPKKESRKESKKDSEKEPKKAEKAEKPKKAEKPEKAEKAEKPEKASSKKDGANKDDKKSAKGSSAKTDDKKSSAKRSRDTAKKEVKKPKHAADDKDSDSDSSGSDSESAEPAPKKASKKEKGSKKGSSKSKGSKPTSDSDSDARVSASRPSTGHVAGRVSVVHVADPRLSLTADPRVSSETRPQEALPRYSLEVAAAWQQHKQEEEARIKHDRAWKRLGRKKDKKEKSRPTRHVEAHHWSVKQINEKLETKVNAKDPKKSKGLDNDQVEASRLRHGENILSKVKTTPLWQKFLLEFVQFFPILLEVGGAACFLAYGLEKSSDDGASNDNLYLGVILFLVVIITAIFSFMQEAKSSAMMEGFSGMNADKATVVRGGKNVPVETEDIVVGDVVILNAGGAVPADVIMVHADRLKVNNSSLTGEMEPQSRSTKMTNENHLETANLAFSSSMIEEGSGIGVVFAIGDHTEIGHIADLTSNTEQIETPLRTEISRFIKIVSAVAIGLGVIFFIAMLAIHGWAFWIQSLVIAIGIIVANVPEGLLPTLTVALTLTAKKLSKKNVLVKNLEAVETLGSCSTICSDKTGTLTLNQMTVVACYYDNEIYSTDRETMSVGVIDQEHESYRRLRQLCALNNRTGFDKTFPENMEKHPRERDVVTFGGNASEIALLRMVGTDEQEANFDDVDDYRELHPLKFEIPFNSDNKWQMSIHGQPDDIEEAIEKVRAARGKGKEPKFPKAKTAPYVVTIKGAPERVLAMCSKILLEGKESDITEEDQTHFDTAYTTLASTGRRVLGFAYKELDRDEFAHCYKKGFEFDMDEENYPTSDYIFVGLTGLMDPPRPEVPQAIADCHTAGVRVVMVTGDHPLTAEAIAREVGILTGPTPDEVAEKTGKKLKDISMEEAPAIVVKGSDVDALTDADWDAIILRKEIVFARTSPEQKLQIVSQFQDRGEIVAVTGDGVNDSPALRKANLGCAMGKTGTAVAKEAADIILIDDNFNSIVVGVRQGRIIFDNLKKSITYTLSSNFAEVRGFVAFLFFKTCFADLVPSHSCFPSFSSLFLDFHWPCPLC